MIYQISNVHSEMSPITIYSFSIFFFFFLNTQSRTLYGKVFPNHVSRVLGRRDHHISVRVMGFRADDVSDNNPNTLQLSFF